MSRCAGMQTTSSTSAWLPHLSIRGRDARAVQSHRSILETLFARERVKEIVLFGSRVHLLLRRESAAATCCGGKARQGHAAERDVRDLVESMILIDL